MKNMIIIGVGVLLLGTSATFGFLYFTGSKQAPEPEVAAAVLPPPPPEVFYFDVKPEFIVNFGEQLGMQFLMIDVSVASLDAKVPEILEQHLPQVRNDLLMLFSSQANEHLYTPEGKSTLGEQASEVVSTVIQQHYPNGEISDLYFTRFVMQ